jgi:hypothetical protein
MAVPSLLKLAVDGTIVAFRYSDALSTTLPCVTRFLVLVNGSRVYAAGAASLHAEAPSSVFPSAALLPLAPPSPTPV